MRLSESGVSNFGQTYANGLRRKSLRPGGDVLDIRVQNRRDKKAAQEFFRKLLKGLQYVPRAIITDKLKSYSAAKAEVLPGVEHCQQKYQNNRAEIHIS